MIALVMVAAACGNSESSGGSTTAKDTGTTAGSDGTATESTEKVAVDAPGVTDTEITVGGVASVTNPLGGKYDTADDGVQGVLRDGQQPRAACTAASWCSTRRGTTSSPTTAPR